MISLAPTKQSLIASSIKGHIQYYLDNELVKEECVPLAKYIADKMDRNYKYLSGLFTKVEGQTIESYFIHCKAEKLKDVLVRTNYSLVEISFLLKYSSPQHMSAQFRKVTGSTPGSYRRKNKAILLAN